MLKHDYSLFLSLLKHKIFKQRVFTQIKDEFIISSISIALFLSFCAKQTFRTVVNDNIDLEDNKNNSDHLGGAKPRNDKVAKIRKGITIFTYQQLYPFLSSTCKLEYQDSQNTNNLRFVYSAHLPKSQILPSMIICYVFEFMRIHFLS